MLSPRFGMPPSRGGAHSRSAQSRSSLLSLPQVDLAAEQQSGGNENTINETLRPFIHQSETLNITNSLNTIIENNLNNIEESKNRNENKA